MSIPCGLNMKRVAAWLSRQDELFQMSNYPDLSRHLSRRYLAGYFGHSLTIQ